MATSSPPRQKQQPTMPFALSRRRTIMACSHCRKRKTRCITTEQPPKNPCARCIKGHFTCEYIAAPEPYYSPFPRTPELHGSQLPEDPGTPMTWPPMSPPCFSRGRRQAPRLPYTDPLPQHHSKSWEDSSPGSANFSFRAPTHGSMQYISPQPHALTHPLYGQQPYLPQYAPAQAAYPYDLQAVDACQYIPAYVPPSIQLQLDYPFDYTQFLNAYDDVF
ncbi:hypothetical protein B0H17DRAFT_18667 [Mycena rosella]|uniref:Zn(2)-C6 fungal-type domain-containing protein n=1 Tax=Mycena rosella TaxID=1033263 RepID=A0AAD7GAY9_MYCRO|nr:hypothetical protein B0H17DRAFT_18667 [Mycena rosella]